MKRIIFDLDNTLITWKDEYLKALDDALKFHKIEIETKKVDEIIENLEKKYEILTKEILLNDINNTHNLNLEMSFIDTLFENQGLLAEYDEELIDTIKYLYEKFDSIVLLSNYYKIVQEKRLETAHIKEYFEEIYGGDSNPLKPRKEAFIKAMGNYKPEECIMIGDDLINDIKGAMDLGIKAIAVDHFDKIKEDKEYKVVKRLRELKQIL